MSQEQLNQAHYELMSAGFRPTRHAKLVKLVRRLLWPFIRPFAFYLQDRIYHLEHRETARQEDIAHLVSEHILLRSEIAALKNQFANNQLSVQVEEIHKRIDGLPSREEQALLRSDVYAIKARYIDEKQNRERHLAVTNTEYGLFIGKPGEIISDYIFSGGVWDEHITTLADEVAKTSSGIAVDVGAHFGSITIALSKIFKEVFAFEPNDFNYRILRGNIAVNGIDNVRLFNCGIYSKETTLSLGKEEMQELPIPTKAVGDVVIFDGAAANNLGAYLFSEGCEQFFPHAAKTLDSFGLCGVSFIKIDVQGADGEVLMGSIDTIKRCQPVIVFEWEEQLSRHFSISFDLLSNTLHGLNYELSILKVHNEKQIDYVARPRDNRDQE